MRLCQNPGRVAGLLYLVPALLGPFTLIYVPSTLFVHGNATATARNIAAHESMFSLAIAIDLLSGIVWIGVILALYRLLRGVNQTLAVVMAVLGGVMVTVINLCVTLNNAAALVLVRGADFVSVFGQAQRDALVMLFLRMHHYGILAAELYWGLWLFPLAVLVYRSRFLPRFLGVWLVLNGVAYLSTSLTGLLWPRYEQMLGTITSPALFGELALMLWLAIKGVDQQTVDASRPAPTATRTAVE